MKELQIYRRGRVYALVDGTGNYSVSSENEESDLCTNFRQDGSWEPVEFEDMPAWLQEQIEEYDLFGVDEGGGK